MKSAITLDPDYCSISWSGCLEIMHGLSFISSNSDVVLWSFATLSNMVILLSPIDEYS